MKAIVLALLSAGLLLAQDFTGTWLGTLEAGAVKLRIGLVVTGAPEKLTANLVSLDQGYSQIPVQSVAVEGRKLKLLMPQINGTYAGELSEDGQTINGKLTQGLENPLVLKRVAELPKPKRSQVVEPPFPYTSVDVTFPSKAEGVMMAGTLTMPKGKTGLAAVVLVTGSGPQDRDETILGHKPFLVLADHLTKAGYAVLRYDDRGVGKSTGSFKGSTSADFAKDAQGAVEFLRKQKEIDGAKVFVAGHSEGGIIAPMVAVADGKLAGIVLLAGTGVTGERVIAWQAYAGPRAMGMTPEQVERTGKSVYDAVKAQSETDAWVKYFWTYDPAAMLERVKCPVLALNGALDRQVNPDENLDAIEAALKKGGNGRVTMLKLAGLNHLFQTAKTGAGNEYGNIEETMSPVALGEITRWLNGQTAKR